MKKKANGPPGRRETGKNQSPGHSGLWGLAVWLAPVLVLGIWHLGDVGRGIKETGHTWQTGVYLALAAAVLAVLALMWRMLLGCGNRRLEQVYPAAGLLLGLLYLFVLPPLSAPDEISHYVSAYQLSSTFTGQPSNDRYGRVLLRPQDAWVEDLAGTFVYEADPDGHLQVTRESLEGAEKFCRVLDESVYRLLWELRGGKQYHPQRTEELKGALVSSTYPPVQTTPLAYVPQALAMAGARLLGMNTIALMYLGRMANLVFFVVMTWLALRRLPFGKEVLMGVALLPMTLHLSASFSYDVMIMGCMFLLTAVCLDLAYKKEQVEPGDVVLLMVLMAVCGPCKMIYAVMMGLCLLVPVRKFGGWGRWALCGAAVGGAWVLAMYVVNSQVVASYVAETESYVQWAGEPGYSILLLVHQPVRLVRMFYQTLLDQMEVWHLGIIGAHLSGLDKVLNVPYGAVALFTLGLLALAFLKPGESVLICGPRRVWVLAVCGLCMAAAMFSMLIAWTPLSSWVINGVQGRYFLPFLPVLLMACKNRLVVLTRNIDRPVLCLMCCLNGYVLLRLFSIVCMRL